MNSFTARQCTICNGLKSRLVSDTQGGAYVQCLLCGTEHQAPHTGERDFAYFVNQQSEFYGDDSHCLSPIFSLLNEHRVGWRLKSLKRYLQKGKVLEVGPGTGDVSAAMQAAGYRVEAVEHSPVLAERIEQIGIRAHVGAFEEMSLPSDGYDAWLSFHVIEHVVDPAVHLRKGLEIVRPGGYAFVATPNAESWEHRFSRCWSPNYSTAHLRLFSSRGIRTAMEKAGWVVLEVRGLPTDDGWLRVATSCLRNLSGRGGPGARRAVGAKGLSPHLAAKALRIFLALARPIFALQGGLDSGNELFAIARRRLI